MVAATSSVDVSITETLFEAELATYRRVPFGDSANALGSAPTVTVRRMCRDGIVRIETVPSKAFATYAVWLFGCIATLLGSRPTGISDCFLSSWGRMRKTVIVFASGLTVT